MSGYNTPDGLRARAAEFARAAARATYFAERAEALRRGGLAKQYRQQAESLRAEGQRLAAEATR